MGGNSQTSSREINAILTFKGGIVCSVGKGKVAVVSVQAQKDADELKLKVVDIIKLPLRNATSAGILSNKRGF